MNSNAFTRSNIRMWSDTLSLRPMAARLGSVEVLHDKGGIIPPPRPGIRARRATRNYLSTAEVIASPEAVGGHVSQFVRLLDGDPVLRGPMADGGVDVVVWVAIFGEKGAAKIADLKIDMKPFGERIGLVVENYTDFEETGNPRQLLVGRAATGRAEAS